MTLELLDIGNSLQVEMFVEVPPFSDGFNMYTFQIFSIFHGKGAQTIEWSRRNGCKFVIT